MNLEVQVGLAQVFIALISLVAAPFIAIAYRDFVSRRGHGIECLARPIETSSYFSRCWMITLNFSKYAGKNSPLIILPSRAGNKVENLNQIREKNEVNFILSVENDRAEINTRSIPPHSSICFFVRFKNNDVPSLYLYGNHIKCRIWHSVFLQRINLSKAQISSNYLLIAHWRSIWIMVGFVMYAMLALLRILYLGFFRT